MTKVAGYVDKYFIKDKKTKEKTKQMWLYCLSLGKDANGKRILRKKRGFESEKEASKALRKAQVEADNGRYIAPSKLTYGEYIKVWFETRKDTLGRMTAINAERNINKHIIPLIGQIMLSELNVYHIEKHLRDLKAKGLAGGTIKKVFSLVNSSLISAVRKDTIPKNPATLAENKPKVPRRMVVVWDEHEIRDFLQHVQNSKSRYYIAFLLALAAGMRQGEILGLRWADIDFKRKLISVKQTLAHDGKDFGPPKTVNSIRTITVDDDTLEALRQHKKFIMKDKWNAKDSYFDQDLVVCTVLGTQCMPRDLDKRWSKFREDTKLNKITFHDLRHTHASLLLKNGVHPKVVSERLGHSSIQITLDLYSHLFPNLQEDAAAGIGRMLFYNNPEAAKEAK